MISKLEARAYGKLMRAGISPDKKREKERIISSRLLELSELSFCTNICIYLPIGSEVDTSIIRDELKRRGKRLFAPVTRGDDMYAVEIKDEASLVTGNFGIKEPVGEYFPKDKLDMVIVPMVSFNSKKARVGYGKGYYDRFLPDGVLTVGIAFSEQESNFEPESFDKSLDIIITDKEVLL